MSHPKPALCCMLIVALSACSSSPAPQAPKATVAAAATAMPASNPLTSLLNTRDRAKSVQQTMDAHAKAERKALQDAQQ